MKSQIVNCMVCMNQDKCDGENCGPEYEWQRYFRCENDDSFVNMIKRKKDV